MPTRPIKFLVTGATSGLGGSVLSTIYKNFSDHGRIAAASSRPDAAAKLQKDYPGIHFRVVAYDDPASLRKAFDGVERLFFVSSPERDGQRRIVQHSNVVRAAKEAGVEHVYYSSLAFGGYSSQSKVTLQQAHFETEKVLRKSGISYTSVREGIYTDAFPVFYQWYPDSTSIFVPVDGPIALTSREELGEATAKLMLRDPTTLSFKDNIALVTASRTYTGIDVAKALSTATGKNVSVVKPSREEYPRLLAEEDKIPGKGGKSEEFFSFWLTLLDGVADGEAATVDPLMGELLGREPRDAMEHIIEMVREAAPRGGYTWHQNYAL